MIYAGTIIEICNKKTYVFTMDCNIVAVRTRKEYILGHQISFTGKELYRDWYQSYQNLIIAAAAVAVITIMVVFASANYIFPSNRTFDSVSAAVVSVDVNPSIEININKMRQIVSTVAKNDDGAKVLEALKLDHKDVLEGVNEIVRTAKQMGYINQDNNEVLVSAALYKMVSEEKDSQDYTLQLKQLLQTLEGSESDELYLTVFIEDSEIIDQANENHLSIGKELLYQYSLAQEDPLTADDIRNTGVTELLSKLNATQQDGQLIKGITETDTAVPTEAVGTPTPTFTPAPTEAVVNPTPTLTPTPTPAKSEQPTTTPKPDTQKVSDSETLQPSLTVTVKDDTLRFSWTALSSDSTTYSGKKYTGFQYYKVVASDNNPNPVYPDDGYLTYITDRAASDWYVTPADQDYNLSPELESGKSYYFSITYVFENGKFSSTTESVKVPEFHEEQTTDNENTEFSDYHISVSSEGDNLQFNWTPISGTSVRYNGEKYTGFNYYKVVASTNNPNPKYPDDGYLTYITDYNQSSWTLAPYTDDYNYSPKLISGEIYYFSITYVFNSGKIYSDTMSCLVP